MSASVLPSADLRPPALVVLLVLGLAAPWPADRAGAQEAAPDSTAADTSATGMTPPDRAAAPHDSASIAPPSALPRAIDDAFHDGNGVESLPIRSIDIEVNDVYEPVPTGRFESFYRVANNLHVRTRRATVKSQLLFKVGDRWSDAKGRELARNLRALDFLTPLRVEAVRGGDSVDVLIRTRDLWTTAPEFNFESSGGKRYGAIGFTERNLLGYGKSIAFAWRHDPVGKSRSVAYEDPNVGGSRARMLLAGGDGSDGAVTRARLGVPYWALDAPRSYGVSFGRITSMPVLYSHGGEIATLNQRLEETEVWWGTGSMRDSIVQRVTWSISTRDKRLGPPAHAGPIPPEFDGVEENTRIRRLNGELKLWRPVYAEKVGVEQMGVIEDLELGRALTLKAGYAPGWFGGESEGYGRAQIDFGIDTDAGFGMLSASIDSRLRTSPREIRQRIDARWVNQSLSHHTFVVATHGDAGLAMDRDFELSVGGLNGLRAYPVHALAGRRLWRFNAEDRVMIGNLFGPFLTVGAVGFVDAAKAWGAGNGGAGWFVDAGTGLRLNAPQWALGRVLRIDLAWPIEPTRDGKRTPVLSVGSSQAF